MRQQNLYGDSAIQSRVAGALYFAHTARTQWREDFLRPQLGALFQCTTPHRRMLHKAGQALARRQLHSTVSGETFNTSAASSGHPPGIAEGGCRTVNLLSASDTNCCACYVARISMTAKQKRGMRRAR